jgi:ribosome assembly protein 1
VFSHWQIIEEDPFHINKTEEELEEFGEQILPPNIAKVLVDKVRKRKVF